MPVRVPECFVCPPVVPVTRSLTAFGGKLSKLNLRINLISVFRTLFHIKIQMWRQVGSVDLFLAQLKVRTKDTPGLMAAAVSNVPEHLITGPEPASLNND